MGYAPLDLLARSEHSGQEFEVRKQQLLELESKDIAAMTEEDYVDFMLSNNFMNVKYNGKFSSINKCLLMNTGTLAAHLNMSVQQFF